MHFLGLNIQRGGECIPSRVPVHPKPAIPDTAQGCFVRGGLPKTKLDVVSEDPEGCSRILQQDMLPLPFANMPKHKVLTAPLLPPATPDYPLLLPTTPFEQTLDRRTPKPYEILQATTMDSSSSRGEHNFARSKGQRDLFASTALYNRR